MVPPSGLHAWLPNLLLLSNIPYGYKFSKGINFRGFFAVGFKLTKIFPCKITLFNIHTSVLRQRLVTRDE